MVVAPNPLKNQALLTRLRIIQIRLLGVPKSQIWTLRSVAERLRDLARHRPVTGRSHMERRGTKCSLVRARGGIAKI